MTQSETTTPQPTGDKSLIVNFFREIRSIAPKAEVESNLWVTKKGVFVRQEYTNTLISIFSQWFQTTTGGAIAVEKATRKLFGEDEQHEFYLIQGSSVVVGNVCECPNNDLRGAGIRLYEGMPIDTVTSLHQTDPFFTTIPGLSAALTRNGFEASLETKYGNLRISFDTLSKFRNWLNQTGEMRKYLVSTSARRCLESLKRSLNFVKNVGKKWHIFIPSRLQGAKDVRLLALGSIYIVVFEDAIVDFFAIRGKSLQELIREELFELTNDPKSRTLAGARVQKVKGSFLATKDVVGLPHTFGVSAVTSFLEQCEVYAERNRGRLPGRMEPQHTARDCVIELSKILSEAEPILLSKAPGRVLTEFPQAYALLVSKGEWFFSVDGHKMIRQVLFAPKQAKKELTLIPLAQKVES